MHRMHKFINGLLRIRKLRKNTNHPTPYIHVDFENTTKKFVIYLSDTENHDIDAHAATDEDNAVISESPTKLSKRN